MKRRMIIKDSASTAEEAGTSDEAVISAKTTQ